MTVYTQPKLPGMPIEHRAPRKSYRDTINGFMAKSVNFDASLGNAIMTPCLETPGDIIAFSDALKCKNPEANTFVHFYEHDYVIQAFWNSPFKYLDHLSRFGGFISPDFSTGPDLTIGERHWNWHRNQLVGAWLQSLGYKALCNARCPSTGDDVSLSGVPKFSNLAIGAVGCIKNLNDRERFHSGLVRLLEEREPSSLIVLGEDAYGIFDCARDRGVKLKFYPGRIKRYYAQRREVANV